MLPPQESDLSVDDSYYQTSVFFIADVNFDVMINKLLMVNRYNIAD